MARSSFFGGLGRMLSFRNASEDLLRAERDAARTDAVRFAAQSAAQQRRADAGQAALEAVRERVDALELELYVTRSDHQRAVVTAENLRSQIARLEAKAAGE